MSDDEFQSPFSTGIRGRCPRCGEGRLFRGYLDLAPGCTVCDLDFGPADSADGPAVFIILILGAIVAGLALMVEVKYQPPIWVHIVLWFPMTIGGALTLLRPAKAIMVALQLKNAATQDIEVD